MTGSPPGPGRVGFAGTPAFARTALAALLDAGFEVPLVLTQPDRPAGRGMKMQASPVKLLAQERGIAVAQPRGLKLDGRFGDDAAAAVTALAAARLDVLVVAAYGLILPPWLLATPAHGCINIHASLLPRWRGAAPIQRAIEAGDATTGVTIMQMDAGLDTGPMLLARALPVPPDATAATLHDELAALGAQLIVEALSQIDRLAPQAQPATGATYAAKLDKADGAIDWSQPAAVIERRVRAFDPAPGCSFDLAGETVKLWRAGLDPADGAPALRCGDGRDLALLELQRSGGRRAPAADVLRGWPAGALALAQAALRSGR